MNTPVPQSPTSALPPEERAVLEKVCEECGVPPDLVEALIREEERVYLMGRRHGIRERIDSLLAQHLGSGETKGVRT